jgi:hypothetical protein
MSTERPVSSPWFPLVLAAVLAAAAGGCTIGPDPFDYTGPVPNGSPPQNDFRARSNGILPLGAAPRPFPPLVDAGPVPAAPQSSVATDDAADGGVRVVAADTPIVAAESVDVELNGAESAPVESGVSADAAVEDAVPPGAAEVPPVQQAVPAPLAETPGWRPRD